MGRRDNTLTENINLSTAMTTSKIIKHNHESKHLHESFNKYTMI